MIRRINLYGSPGAGKSTTCSFLFYNLKKMGYNIEMVTEYIKMWTYIPRVPVSWDSYYCQSKQLIKEDTILRSGVDLIITDSPIFLSSYYSKKDDCPGQEVMNSVAREFEKMYPSTNLLIKRSKEKKYQKSGRYQSEEESDIINENLYSFLLGRVEFKDFYSNESEKVLKYVIKELGN